MDEKVTLRLDEFFGMASVLWERSVAFAENAIGRPRLDNPDDDDVRRAHVFSLAQSVFSSASYEFLNSSTIELPQDLVAKKAPPDFLEELG